VKVGDRFSAVNGQDVSALDDADVAALCRGVASMPLTVKICGSAYAKQLAELLYEAARLRNAEEVQSLLNTGALPDALFRGIVVSRRKA